MNRRLFLFAVSAVALLVSTGLAADLTHTKDSLDVVKTRVGEKKAILIDVRSEDEWKDGHLKSAMHLPITELAKLSESEIREKLPKDKIIYTHCAVGARALKAGKLIEKFGYDIRPLKPGYEDLVKAGFDVDK